MSDNNERMCLLRSAMSRKKMRQFFLQRKSSKHHQQQTERKRDSEDRLEIKALRVQIRDGRAPEYLTVHYPPRNGETDLQINGKSVKPSSSAFQTLRRCNCIFSAIKSSTSSSTSEDNNDGAAAVEEDQFGVTYVNTECVQIKGKICFEICSGEAKLVCSALDCKEMMKSNLDFKGMMKKSDDECGSRWALECSCALDQCWGGEMTGEDRCKRIPSLEVCVAAQGRDGPVLLTQRQILVVSRKRSSRRDRTSLEVIPEGNDYENSFFSLELDGNGVELDSRTAALLCTTVVEKLSWLLEPRYPKGFSYKVLTLVSTGIMLGVGIGLGAFLGLGVGAGLLALRTYQSASLGHQNA